jgi:hypothetical protein
MFLLLLLPWLIQVAATPPGYIPTGHLTGYSDYVTFIAKIEWGRAEHWTYIDRYTSEVTEPVPMYWLYLLLGHLARWTGLSSLWDFHLARSLLGAISLLMWWLFCGRYSRYPSVSFVLGLWASFGFIPLLGGSLQHELFVQGHAAYIGLLGFPHYLVDFLAILALFSAYLSERRTVLLPILAGVGFGAVHPFLLALYPAVILVQALVWEREQIKRALTVTVWAGLGALPFVLPLFFAYMNTEWLQIWREQTATQLSWWDDVLRLIVTFGIAGILAWVAVPKALRAGVRAEKLAAVWMLVSGLFFLCAPLPNRREFAFFLSLPVGLLAAPLLAGFSRKVNTLKHNFLLPALVVFCCAFAFRYTAEIFVMVPDMYLHKDLIAGLEWMEKHSKVNDTVICTWGTGSLIPMYIKHPRPWVGHPTETLQFKSKIEAVRPFFAGKSALPGEWAVLAKRIDEDLPRLKKKPAYENQEITIWMLKEEGENILKG